MVLVLSQAEVSASIIAACVPFCRPLVKKLTTREASKESNGSDGSTPPCRSVAMGGLAGCYRKAAGHRRLGSLGESESDGKRDGDCAGGYGPEMAV